MGKIKVSVLLLSISFFIASGCETYNKEFTHLSDRELENFLSNNADFEKFIQQRQLRYFDLYSRVKNLKDIDKEQIYLLQMKYDNYLEFISNGKSSEAELFRSIILNEVKSTNHLSKVKNSLGRYEYSKIKLVELISINLNKVRERTIDLKHSRRYNHCQEIYWDVYLKVFNRLLSNGIDIDDADRDAVTAASWAYYGCITYQRKRLKEDMHDNEKEAPVPSGS